VKEEKKEIDGVTYVVKELDAISALKLQVRLAKLLGPSFKEAVAENSNNSIAGAMISSLVSNMQSDETLDLILSLFKKNVFYEHEHEGDTQLMKVSFETHFSGKLPTMWKVALFVLQVNFSELMGKFLSNSRIKSELDKLKKENSM